MYLAADARAALYDLTERACSRRHPSSARSLARRGVPAPRGEVASVASWVVLRAVVDLVTNQVPYVGGLAAEPFVDY